MKFKKWDLSPFQKTKISNQTPRFYCAKDKLPMNSLNQKYPFLQVIISLLLMLVLHPPTNPMQCNRSWQYKEAMCIYGSTLGPCLAIYSFKTSKARAQSRTRDGRRARALAHMNIMMWCDCETTKWAFWCSLSLSLSLCVSLLTLCVLWIRLLLGMF